jgi:hypothetical protein
MTQTQLIVLASHAAVAVLLLLFFDGFNWSTKLPSVLGWYRKRFWSDRRLAKFFAKSSGRAWWACPNCGIANNAGALTNISNFRDVVSINRESPCGNGGGMGCGEHYRLKWNWRDMKIDVKEAPRITMQVEIPGIRREQIERLFMGSSFSTNLPRIMEVNREDREALEQVSRDLSAHEHRGDASGGRFNYSEFGSPSTYPGTEGEGSAENKEPTLEEKISAQAKRRLKI